MISRTLRNIALISIVVGCHAVSALSSLADDAKTIPAPALTLSELDRINLEQNLRWQLQRERDRATRLAEKGSSIQEHVAVFADAGVWHVGARSIVEALERQQINCRVIDRTQLNKASLSMFEVLVLPGGWAPHQWAVAGDEGLSAIRSFVESGGRCVGVCAGAYLLAKTTRYDGIEYAYPLGLFDGAAVGPVAGLAPFPQRGAARLSVTDAGLMRGIPAEWTTIDGYYSGGPWFQDGTHVAVLARYRDGSAAVISRPLVKGEVVLVGAHIERPISGGDTAAVPEHAQSVLKALLFPSR